MKVEDISLSDLNVSRETELRLRKFIALFDKWARTINLVAPSTLEDFGARHIRDSAQIYELRPAPLTWIDLGSGGGFPGIITAILLHEADGGWVHLVESNNKKAAFLRQAIAETGARASVHPVRIETALEQSRPNPMSARAAIAFQLAPGDEGVVSLRVFDVSGRRIRTLAQGYRPAGPHHVEWDRTDDSGARVGRGVYFYRLQTPRRTIARKLVVAE